MQLFSKMLLVKKKTDDVYTNYITQVVPYPATRIQIDSYADDYRTINVSNVTTQLGYLRFYVDMSRHKLTSDSGYVREITDKADYWQMAINPTLGGMKDGNTYEIPCSIVDADNNVVQKFTIYYTRTI